MKITIEVDEVEEAERLLKFLEEGKFISPEQATINLHKFLPESYIQKGDKSLDPRAMEGIWKDNPRTLEEIRRAAWGDRL